MPGEPEAVPVLSATTRKLKSATPIVEPDDELDDLDVLETEAEAIDDEDDFDFDDNDLDDE